MEMPMLFQGNLTISLCVHLMWPVLNKQICHVKDVIIVYVLISSGVLFSDVDEAVSLTNSTPSAVTKVTVEDKDRGKEQQPE